MKVPVTAPARGDVLAGISVALVLVPQAMAYAEIAGLQPSHGLYAAAAAPLAGALVGSSPYLQTGPVAVTSLLTFGALSGIADPFTARFALLAGLLAIIVGVIRMGVGLLGGGPIAYLMSQPVVTSFTTAAALLIVGSQVPALLGVDGVGGSPLVEAVTALGEPQSWRRADILLGLGAMALMLLGRRISPLFPGALLAVVAATAWSVAVDYAGSAGNVVGDITVGLHAPESLPLSDLGSLLVPGLVIALVGFAEPASIARRYAAQDRCPWDSNREFVGQGLANVASGLAGGYPVGGSFSRTALNRLGGARSRWSGVFTGLAVLAVLPVAGVLAPLPTAVLAGLVIAAAVSLVDVPALAMYWKWSRPQFLVALVTVVATLALAPRVERGVIVGVGTALAVHLWRELMVRVPSRLEGTSLHLWPSGVLYFGSAPGMERTVNELIAAHPQVTRVVVHLGGLGRVDLTGALTLRDLVDEARASGVTVEIRGAAARPARLLTRVLGDDALVESTPG
ncbi:MAG TPA: SulP family inorganic anion transporter [Nocardioidaceae bacterium]|nr:SulP family inorganic anion transporter [Nocardioidaceae bacterium]